jgi:acyl-coenzyme A synthetase/AMP-(fatty) acid ligase
MIFLIDQNEITYDQLINYTNGENLNNLSDFELKTLNFIKKISSNKSKDIDSLLDNIKKYSNEIIIDTSGTTGDPKQIKHTISSLTKNIKINNVIKNWGSVYQNGKMAFYQILFQSLFNKSTLINLNGYSVEQIHQRIEKYNVNSISGTPTFYRILLSLNETMNSIEQVTLGGESSDSKLIESLKKYFPNAKITNVYASTEGGALFASNSNIFKISDKIKIIDNILYVHKDYIKSSFEGDWYKTGDLVELVNDNEFIIIGKQEKEINVSGVKVNLSKVEFQINSLPYILDSYVYSRKNSMTGNIICSDIILKDDNITKNKIKNDLSDFLNKHEIPIIINLVKEIKINQNMKKVI